jgi:YjbE family integral membrane protein
MDLTVIGAAGGIALVDLVLSGDNALVIGVVASRLPRSHRLLAIVWGALGAIILRVLFAIAATELLTLEYLQAAGGIVLLGIAIRLLLPEGSGAHRRAPKDRLLPAISTIILADLTMSLDNVLAVGALAAGHIVLLVCGLLLSMILLFSASSIIARLVGYFGWLLDLAAAVLAWTAANLVLQDPVVVAQLGRAEVTALSLAVHLGSVALILVVDVAARLVLARRGGRHAPHTDGSAEASMAAVEEPAPPWHERS